MGSFASYWVGPHRFHNPGSTLCYRSNKLTVAWYVTYLLMVGWFLVFNSTFSNISAISWRPVLVVEEARVPWKNHRPWESNYITFDQTAYWIESAWIEGIYL